MRFKQPRFLKAYLSLAPDNGLKVADWEDPVSMELQLTHIKLLRAYCEEYAPPANTAGLRAMAEASDAILKELDTSWNDELGCFILNEYVAAEVDDEHEV